eukprot:357003-Chlamydomonas_euryale.AAC.7
MVCTCASRGTKEGKGKRKTTHQSQKGQQAGRKDGGKKGALTTHMQSKETQLIPIPCARHRTGNGALQKLQGLLGSVRSGPGCWTQVGGGVPSLG